MARHYSAHRVMHTNRCTASRSKAEKGLSETAEARKTPRLYPGGTVRARVGCGSAALRGSRVGGLLRGAGCLLCAGLLARTLPNWLRVASALLALLPGLPAAGAVSATRFNRDIRPVLSENCFACHGPDANKRKAGLRLDTKDGIFERTAKHEPAVVPGKLEKSELWRRITATDPDDVMPPPKSHKTLKPEQKELFKQWILAGASWQGHWAYIKPERPKVRDRSEPKVQGSKFKARNPIDAFVRPKLHGKG